MTGLQSTDVVSELRTMARELSKIVGEPVESNTAWRAADEIERLRAGLLKIATGGAKWPVGEAALILYGEEKHPDVPPVRHSPSCTSFYELECNCGAVPAEPVKTSDGADTRNGDSNG